MVAGRRQIMSSYEEATANSSIGSPKIEVCMDLERLGPGQSAHCCPSAKTEEEERGVGGGRGEKGEEEEEKGRGGKEEKEEKDYGGGEEE